MPRADLVNLSHMENTMEWVCKKFNGTVEDVMVANDKVNMDKVQAFCEGGMNAEQLADSLAEFPKTLQAKDYKHMARKMKKSMNMTKQVTNTGGNYLPYDDVEDDGVSGQILQRFGALALLYAVLCSFTLLYTVLLSSYFGLLYYCSFL